MYVLSLVVRRCHSLGGVVSQCTSFGDCCDDYQVTCVQNFVPTVCGAPCFETEAEAQAAFLCLGNCGQAAGGQCFCDALVREQQQQQEEEGKAKKRSMQGMC